MLKEHKQALVLVLEAVPGFEFVLECPSMTAELGLLCSTLF
jgi:hypothetical protein